MQVVTTHTGADFDALSSLLAASKLYPEAKIFIPGSPEKKVRHFLRECGFPGRLNSFNEIENGSLDLLVIVDTSYPERLGRIRRLIDKDTRIHIYDHHPETKGSLQGEKVDRREYGATTTILLEKIIEMKIPLTPEESTLMALGIYEDTGCMTYPLTSYSDLTAAAFLLRSGADLRAVTRYNVHEMNRDQVDLLSDLLYSRVSLSISAGTVVMLEAKLQEYIEDLSVVVHKAMEILNPETVFAFIEIENRVICISRSRSRDINVGKILADFGGGGHATAASACFDRTPVSEIRKNITEYLETMGASCEGSFRIVRKPARVVPEDHTVERVLHTMTHLNVEFMPVGLRDGLLSGIVQKSELEKAVRHGFSASSVSEFASADIPSIEKGASGEDITRKLVNSGFRFLALRDGGKIIGVVEEVHKAAAAAAEEYPDYDYIGDRLDENLDSRVAEILEVASGIADRMGITAYCVGGMVRDVLLGHTHKDIDIVAEKKGISFARELAGELGGRLSVYEKFLTAVIKLDEREIDIATLRNEYYEFPAALPDVSEGTLKQDLYRRDFTVNAMAIQINRKEYGRLIDYFGGRSDIKNRVIRILYPLSFVEDPTRIFRAVRFEKRFGFSISEDTLTQLNSTVKLDIHSRLTNDRVKGELMRILKDARPNQVLMRLSSLGVLSCIHPDLVVTDRIYDAMEEYLRMEDSVKQHIGADASRYRAAVLLLILFTELNTREAVRVFKEFHFRSRFISLFNNVRDTAGAILDGLKQSVERSDIYERLSGMETEALLYIMAVYQDRDIRRKIMLYMKELKETETELSGRDLIDMGYRPGPEFSRMLSELRKAKLDGKLSMRRDEEKFIAERYPRD